MDFSEKYIKMCQRAKEIQKGWEIKEGDRVIIRNTNKNYLVYQSTTDSVRNKEIIILIDGSIIERSFCVWLPHQDQLQEMLKPYFADIFSMVVNFGLWCDGTYSLNISKNYIKQFTTMEELWLTFLMYEKYRKIWDNKKEEWIKKEKK